MFEFPEYDSIIDIKEYHNASCLACGKVEPEMFKIGLFFMCPKCKDAEFSNMTGIIPESPTGEVYYKWVSIYTKR